jgi:hypothetical protein
LTQQPWPVATKTPEASKLPIELNAAQQDQLMRRTLPYNFIDQLLADPSSLLSEVASTERYRVLDALIVKAEKHGFDGMRDLGNFCRLGLSYGPKFDECEPIKTKLDCKLEGQHVHELWAGLSAHELQKLENA